MLSIFDFQLQTLSHIWVSKKVMLDQRSGLNYYLSQSSYPFASKTHKSMQLIEHPSPTISTLEIRSIHRSDTIIKIAQVGTHLKKDDPVIILPKSIYPLKLAGLSSIVGHLKIPFGRIEQYSGLQSQNKVNIQKAYPTLNTSTELSPKVIPVRKNTKSKYVESLLSLPKANSFLESTLIYFSSDPIYLDEEYSGNIIIESTQKITLSSQSKIDMLIIKAPQIIVEEGWTGRASFIAQENMQIGNFTEFKYPSSIVISSYSPHNTSFELPESSVINGSVNFYGGSKNSAPIIAGEINGNLFSEIPLSFTGHLSGQLWIPHFFLATSGSSYTNLVQNASFDHLFQLKKIPLPFFYPNKPKAFIQWLN